MRTGGGGAAAAPARRRRRTLRRRPAPGHLVVKRHLILLIGLDQSQPRDILLMLLVGFREGMAAGAIGHEIEFARPRRIGRGFERGRPGLAIGPGGNPSMR